MRRNEVEKGDFGLNIDKYGRVPIYEQIVNSVEKEISTGVLKPMDQLQSVRELALEISVNPNTIQKAYAELERRGMCYSAPGQGRFVSPDAPKKLKEMAFQSVDKLKELVCELMKAGICEEDLIKVVKDCYAKEGTK